MDPVGFAAVVLLFGGIALFLLAISPIGKAVAARISGKKGPADQDEMLEELKQLQQEVDELRHAGEQLNELGERVDFLERLIAQQRDAERLAPPSAGGR